MDVSTGAAIVIALGVAALVASLVLLVFLRRLDRQESARREPSSARRQARVPHEGRQPYAA